MKLRFWKLAGLAAILLFATAVLPGITSASELGGKWYADKHAPFMIKVVDSQTGRGIPLVELRTTNNISYYTDSAGVAAFNEPGLMDQSVFFHMTSDGYEVPADFFGYHGQAVTVTPGGSATLQMNRVNIAERLYRVTGQGIYRDSLLLGLDTPIKEPVVNGLVMGQDSVQTIKYRNKLYWFWGDTDRPAYPLGNFRTTGATSKLPGNGGLDPDVGVDLKYFTQPDGFVKSMVPPLSDGANMAWVFGLMTAKDATGKERLLAGYSTLNPELVSHGILAFNDETEQFEQVVQFPSKDDWRHPGGQASYYEENGKGYWLFTEHRIPNLRVAASYEAIIDPNQYEAFTCLMPGTAYDGANSSLERDANGKLVWGWKKNAPPVSQDQEKELIQLGLITADDTHYYQLKSADDGEEVQLAQSSVEWNPYRQRYVMIGQQLFGKTSVLGEIWYAEAASPQGPWTTGKKIITHDNYTFYNPAQHPIFSKDGGRVIYFEATYTNTYTEHVPTPRYNYNQVMYKLDLGDPRLGLQPVQSPAE
ncbi:DUF4185 domain-containing protein [Paenibacillus sacheonensis]|uniref:DUF4185 domain-containing protein n=1 Tax=Paenibacillus sacheonensis TaxID=742054 RepID=A0A7X4YRE4_9BACL|nr:DUF4185 domain-containing protein [Paenibacillus sacheonensis]MBM7565036.1 hypothetical protein [Paenibacillus sacheonensis]NBC70179.1 hypothetical protein [Paenibacillus sacheonensis]